MSYYTWALHPPWNISGWQFSTLCLATKLHQQQLYAELSFYISMIQHYNISIPTNTKLLASLAYLPEQTWLIGLRWGPGHVCGTAACRTEWWRPWVHAPLLHLSKLVIWWSRVLPYQFPSEARVSCLHHGPLSGVWCGQNSGDMQSIVIRSVFSFEFLPIQG